MLVTNYRTLRPQSTHAARLPPAPIPGYSCAASRGAALHAQGRCLKRPWPQSAATGGHGRCAPGHSERGSRVPCPRDRAQRLRRPICGSADPTVSSRGEHPQHAGTPGTHTAADTLTCTCPVLPATGLSTSLRKAPDTAQPGPDAQRRWGRAWLPRAPVCSNDGATPAAADCFPTRPERTRSKGPVGALPQPQRPAPNASRRPAAERAPATAMPCDSWPPAHGRTAHN